MKGNLFDLVGGDLPTTYGVRESTYHLAHVAAQRARETWIEKYHMPKRIFDYRKKCYVASDFINGTCFEVNDSDIERLRTDLYRLEVTARDARLKYKQKWDIATKKTVRTMSRNIAWGELGLSVAQITRDLSIDFIVVGGTLLTGPIAGMAVKAGGSVLKGGAKWQDTGKVGAGVMVAGTGFITLIIPIPKGGSYALVFAKKATDVAGGTLVGLAEGKSLKEATISSAVDVATGAALDKIGDKISTIQIGSQAEIITVALEGKIIPVEMAKAVVGTAKDKTKGVIAGKVTETIIDFSKTTASNPYHPMKSTRVLVTALVDGAILGPNSCSQENLAR